MKFDLPGIKAHPSNQATLPSPPLKGLDGGDEGSPPSNSRLGGCLDRWVAVGNDG